MREARRGPLGEKIEAQRAARLFPQKFLLIFFLDFFVVFFCLYRRMAQGGLWCCVLVMFTIYIQVCFVWISGVNNDIHFVCRKVDRKWINMRSVRVWMLLVYLYINLTWVVKFLLFLILG